MTISHGAARSVAPDARSVPPQANRERCEATVHPVPPAIKARGVLRLASMILMMATATHAAASSGGALLTSSAAVDDVRLASAPAGKSSELRFRLRNHSGAPLTLLGADSTLAGATRLLARVSSSEWVEMESITIPVESALDLASSHLRIVFENVRATLAPDSVVPVALRFVQGTLVVDAHVTGEE